MVTGKDGPPAWNGFTLPSALYEEGSMDSVDSSKVLEITRQPAVSVERFDVDKVSYEITNIPNSQAMRIISKVLPEALELYMSKSRDYGGNVMDRFGLGPKACIPDIARKFGKLVDAIWLDKPMQFEQPDEILMDLLGHIFIILDERRSDVQNDDLYEVAP